MNNEIVDRAFPMQYADDSYQCGMTLRDYFAAKSLVLCGPLHGHHPNEILKVAQLAYKMADAMLEARK